MFMQVYTALYHAFTPPLYAGTLYQGLYQVYATRAPLGFIPGRLALYQVSLPSPCGLPVVSRGRPLGLPRPPVARRGLAWLGLALAWLAIFFLRSCNFFRNIICSHEFSSALASGAITFGTPFLMNSVLPVCFMAAYAVHCFALCWCYVALVA